MVGSVRQGAALLAAMVIIFGVWVGFTGRRRARAESGRPSRRGALDRGQHRGQGSALRGYLDARCSGWPRPTRHRLGRRLLRLVHPHRRRGTAGRDDARGGDAGGAGSGLYTILIYAIIAVFIGGLMIGRTPEYLGKKIQATEVKLAGLGALVMPLIVLVFTAIAVSIHAGRAGP